MGLNYPVDLEAWHAWQQRHSAPRLQRLLKRLLAWRK